MNPKGETLECVCGCGRMVLRCAGKSAQNAGRYYLKCPVNGKHPGSFKWYDEVASDTMQRSWNLKTERGKRAEDVPGADSRSEPKTSALMTSQEVDTIRTLAQKTNVLILFTGLVLVMVLVMIGKIV